MAEYRRTFAYEVFTPEGVRYEGRASMVMFPGADGMVGVLANRSPLLAAIGGGPFTVQSESGDRKVYYLAGGFAQVRENRMTILADECIPLEQIDAEEAWEDIERARRLPAATPEEVTVRSRHIAAAQTKFRLVQKLRKPARRTAARGMDEE